MPRRLAWIVIVPLIALLAVISSRIRAVNTPPPLPPSATQRRMEAAEKDPATMKQMMEEKKAYDLGWEKRMKDRHGPVKDTYTSEWFRTGKDGEAGLRALKAHP